MKTMLAMLMVLTILGQNGKVAPEQLSVTEPALIRATVYLPTGNPTASGVMPYEGVLAGRKEDIGKAAILYNSDMELIGVFEFCDTGSAKGLKNGTVIDVYRDSVESYREWVATYGDYVYIQYIDAEG